ncbi:hypothetical protein PIROE2DRAFT_10192 [Piromyces sp. E2]|nr:hypothetical protein PIROE2DRAFT_10192 [Piromyces sp. E2]|eukprot:OUM63293.1 hypothetical protein PIROE2DRAFT_10192 [Piromyces sp. E2]
MKNKTLWNNNNEYDDDDDILSSDLKGNNISKRNKNKNSKTLNIYRSDQNINEYDDDDDDDVKSTTSSCFTNYSPDTLNTVKGILLVRNSNNLHSIKKKSFEHCKVVLIMDAKILSIELLLDSDVSEKIEKLYNKEINKSNNLYKGIDHHYIHSVLRDKRQIISMLNISLCRDINIIKEHIIRFVVEDLTWYEFLIQDDNEFRRWMESMENVLKQNLNDYFGIDYVPKTIEDYNVEENDNNSVSGVLNQYSPNSTTDINNTKPTTSFYTNLDVNNLYKYTKKKISSNLEEIKNENVDSINKYNYVMEHSVNLCSPSDFYGEYKLKTSPSDYSYVSVIKSGNKISKGTKNKNKNRSNDNLSIELSGNYSSNKRISSVSSDAPYLYNKNLESRRQDNEINMTNKLLKNYNNFSNYNNKNFGSTPNYNFDSKDSMYDRKKNKSSDELHISNDSMYMNNNDYKEGSTSLPNLNIELNHDNAKNKKNNTAKTYDIDKKDVYYNNAYVSENDYIIQIQNNNYNNNNTKFSK